MEREMIEAELIGRNLRGMRTKCGYSQKRIARILGVSFQQVQKYEKGVNRLPVEKLYRLQSFYGVPYDDFFKGLNDGGIQAAFDPADIIVKRVSKLDDQALKRKIYEVNLILLGEASISHIG